EPPAPPRHRQRGIRGAAPADAGVARRRDRALDGARSGRGSHRVTEATLAHAMAPPAPGPARRRRRLSRETLLGGATLVGFVLAWKLVHVSGLFPPWAFPSPEQVVAAFVKTPRNGVVLKTTVSSVERQLAGDFLAALLGIPAGLLLGASGTF